MPLSLILMTLRGDTNALCSFDLENVTLVPAERVTLAVCRRAQPALTCAPGEAHSLPAGHPLKWLGQVCDLLLWQVLLSTPNSLPKAALAADGAKERRSCPTRGRCWRRNTSGAPQCRSFDLCQALQRSLQRGNREKWRLGWGL